MAMEAIVGGLDDHVSDRLDLVGLGRWDEVVEEGVAPDEALDAEELLRVQRAIRPAVLCVALRWDAAPTDVVHVGLRCLRL